MTDLETNEKRFEADIEAALLSPDGGYVKGTHACEPKLGLYVGALIDFVKKTQPKEWARFENANGIDTEREFCLAFSSACDMNGPVSVLRRGITFRVCYFWPESSLKQTAAALYARNRAACCRQRHYSADSGKRAWTWCSGGLLRLGTEQRRRTAIWKLRMPMPACLRTGPNTAR